jgi:hypothetical protein
MSRRRSYLRPDDELMTDVDDFDFEAWMDALEDRVKTAPRRVVITDDPEPTYDARS